MKSLLALVSIILLLGGCVVMESSEQSAPTGPTCNAPYIVKGMDCCLDQDKDKVCDEDQKAKEPAPEPETTVEAQPEPTPPAAEPAPAPQIVTAPEPTKPTRLAHIMQKANYSGYGYLLEDGPESPVYVKARGEKMLIFFENRLEEFNDQDSDVVFLDHDSKTAQASCMWNELCARSGYYKDVVNVTYDDFIGTSIVKFLDQYNNSRIRATFDSGIQFDFSTYTVQLDDNMEIVFEKRWDFPIIVRKDGTELMQVRELAIEKSHKEELTIQTPRIESILR